MAQTEHLPIYKSAYDLCLYFELVVRNLSRYYKYSLSASCFYSKKEQDDLTHEQLKTLKNIVERELK